MDVHAACWSISHFKAETQCNLQVNNMCEAFNKAILEYRDKSIITLLEGIKHYITLRIATQKDALGRCKGIISPKIQQVLEKTNRQLKDEVQFGILMMTLQFLRCQMVLTHML